MLCVDIPPVSQARHVPKEQLRSKCHWLLVAFLMLTRRVVPRAEFTAVVKEFEDWTELLLLDALQRSGFFTADGKALSPAELQSRVPAGYKRFMAEATELLKASGSSIIQKRASMRNVAWQ